MRSIDYILIVFVSVFVVGCKNGPAEDNTIVSSMEIEKVIVEKNQIKLNTSKGQWFYKGQPFYGYAVTYHENDSLAEKTGFINGKREGKSYSYYSNGIVKKEASYKENKLHGLKTNYFENGEVVSEFNYVDGKSHGVQKIWFPNGQLAKKRNLNLGKEEGMQQAWLENGKLYVNYEAKNGRVFGLMRANLCYKLEDENVVRKN